MSTRNIPEPNRYSFVGEQWAESETTIGTSTAPTIFERNESRIVRFNVNRGDIFHDSEIINKKLGECKVWFPPGEFKPTLNIWLDDSTRLEYNEIVVYMEADRIGPSPAVEAMEEVPPVPVVAEGISKGWRRALRHLFQRGEGGQCP